MPRNRRPWTEEEDRLLRTAVQQEHLNSNYPTKWLAIAKRVPGRNNKDCRKRWCTKMSAFGSKGAWSAEEDDLLLKAVEMHGTKWSLVAAMVESRKSSQCARRWNDTLNPDIDKTPWTRQEDIQLSRAVIRYGKSWSRIAKTYFPGRTGLSAKNRYVAITKPILRGFPIPDSNLVNSGVNGVDVVCRSGRNLGPIISDIAIPKGPNPNFTSGRNGTTPGVVTTLLSIETVPNLTNSQGLRSAIHDIIRCPDQYCHMT